MKIKFEELNYQNDAINSICDLFQGVSLNNFDDDYQNEWGQIIPNKFDFSDELISANFEKITSNNGIKCSSGYNKSLLAKNKFEIEMETGTGKTFVYLKTIFELNKRYGLNKFIIFCPSIAIKEGIKKTIEQTDEYFKTNYNNKSLQWFIWDSKISTTELRNFITNTNNNNINLMIATIQGFKNIEKNLAHKENELLGFANNKPIDLLRATKPVLIIDEPQKTTSSDNSKKVIDEYIKPLFTLSYSATHKEINNLIYRLSAADAYRKKLVKKIYVSSSNEEIKDETKSILRIKEFKNNKNSINVKVELSCLTKKGIEVKPDVLTLNDNLYYVSGKNPFYQGYIVESINSKEKSITFANGVTIYKETDEINDEARKLLIRRLIETHLQKEAKNLKYNVKTLSLFFIDRVERYRKEDDDKNIINGEYAEWFNEIYQSVILDPKNKYFVDKLPDEYKDLKTIDINSFHDGYFSEYKKHKTKDDSDTAAYDLILKDKEKLLSLDNKVRFIFSHSALNEGWDNPNVFNICLLKDGIKNEITRRQEIGRGLRLCVNQNGERLPISDYSTINNLHIISSETFKSFIENLQKEKDEDVNNKKTKILSFNDEIGHELCQKVLDYLTKNNYIDRGEVKKDLISFYDNNKSFDFVKELGLTEQENQLVNKWILEEINQDISTRIGNANNLITPTINKEKFKEFEPVIKDLKTPHFFSFEENVLDINFLSSKIINEIRKEINLENKKITFSDNEILKYGGNKIEKGTTTNITEYDLNYETDIKKLSSSQKEAYRLFYINDILKQIAKITNLLISTIDSIIKESGTLNYLFINREDYKNTLIHIFKENVFNYLSADEIYKNINYHFFENKFFDIEKVINSLSSDIEQKDDANIFIDETSNNKSVFSAYKLHSNNEVEVANYLNNRNDVELFTKLSSLNIKMPFSKYNPDWFIKRSNNKIVLESKVKEGYEHIKSSEKFKIDIFSKFINQLNEKTNKDYSFEMITKDDDDLFKFKKKTK